MAVRSDVLETGLIGLTPMRRSLALVLCLLIVGGPATLASGDRSPGQKVQSAAGADDPLLLSPAGLGITTSLRVPDRLHFAFASAQLDPNAWRIAVLQAQVLASRAGDTTTLVCAASADEIARLGEALARELAASRCRAVVEAYGRFGVRVDALDQQLSPMDGEEARIAALIVMPGPESQQPIRPLPLDIDNRPWPFGYRDHSGLYLPSEVFFESEKSDLSPDARALLDLLAAATSPEVEVYLSCFQRPGEGMSGPGSNSLARARCQNARSNLIEHGHCEHRVINGPIGGASVLEVSVDYPRMNILIDETDLSGHLSSFPSCQ